MSSRNEPATPASLEAAEDHTEANATTVAAPPSQVKPTDPPSSNASSAATPPPTPQAQPLGDIMAASPDDGNELIRRRFLCRGGGALLVGQAGIGKSSLMIQLSMGWSIPRDLFGFSPTRSLTSLIIQAENDLGDLAEMRDGCIAGLGLTASEAQEATSRVWIYTEDALTGKKFFSKVVRPLIEHHRPDIVWIDPSLAYLGGDANSQRDVGGFLRNELNPLLHQFHCAGFCVHHAAKPSRENGKPAWKARDFAYLGSGSAEWANWARGIITLRADGSVFELAVPKRGRRLGWKSPDGSPCELKFIAHHPSLLCWREAPADEVPKPGRPKNYDPSEIAALLTREGLRTTEWLKLAQEECGVSESTFHRARRQLQDENYIKRGADWRWRIDSIVTRLSAKNVK